MTTSHFQITLRNMNSSKMSAIEFLIKNIHWNNYFSKIFYSSSLLFISINKSLRFSLKLLTWFFFPWQNYWHVKWKKCQRTHRKKFWQNLYKSRRFVYVQNLCQAAKYKENILCNIWYCVCFGFTQWEQQFLMRNKWRTEFHSHLCLRLFGVQH